MTRRGSDDGSRPRRLVDVREERASVEVVEPGCTHDPARSSQGCGEERDAKLQDGRRPTRDLPEPPPQPARRPGRAAFAAASPMQSEPSSACGYQRRRSSFTGRRAPQLLHPLGADARHGIELVDESEWAVLLAEVDDPLSGDWADAGDSLRRPRETRCSGGSVRRERRRARRSASPGRRRRSLLALPRDDNLCAVDEQCREIDGGEVGLASRRPPGPRRRRRHTVVESVQPRRDNGADDVDDDLDRRLGGRRRGRRGRPDRRRSRALLRTRLVMSQRPPSARARSRATVLMSACRRVKGTGRHPAIVPGDLSRVGDGIAPTLCQGPDQPSASRAAVTVERHALVDVRSHAPRALAAALVAAVVLAWPRGGRPFRPGGRAGR